MDFDPLASVYDRIGRLWFGNALERIVLLGINRVKKKSRILVIGGGTGKLLQELDDEERTVDYFEASERMLQKAQNRQFSGKIKFHYVPASHIPDLDGYDLIILPFVLDTWPSEQVEIFLEKLSKSSFGKLLICDFSPPRSAKQKITAQLMLWFFRILARIKTNHIPDLEATFKGSRFTLIEKNCLKSGFICYWIYQ